MSGLNSIAWFEIGTDDPAQAERFYGAVFGWTAAHDDTKSTDPAYRIVSTGADEGLHTGALFDTKGAMAGYAVFAVLVEDVAAACRRAEEAGGTVQRAPQVSQVGVTFAHLHDPAGNHFAVFTPPSGPAGSPQVSAS